MGMLAGPKRHVSCIESIYGRQEKCKLVDTKLVDTRLIVLAL